MPPVPSAPQLAAIRGELAPAFVVAGPGAGKTFCLIERIRYLIGELGVPPERICALTFTNKAAEEIAHRLVKELGPRADAIRRSTIHSLAVALLREFGARLGLARGFGIADEEYQREVLSWIGVKAERRGGVLGRMSLHRLMGQPLLDRDQRAFRHYRKHLEKRGMVDFDDLVILVAELLTNHPDVTSQVQNRWDVILVDEFQDLNHLQYAIVHTLAAKHRVVFGVGDDEQSIFSWTGADPRIIGRFLNDFEIVKPVYLTENRRSARQIFELARRLVSKNEALFQKPLEAIRESQYPVEARSFDTDVEEQDWLLLDLARQRRDDGIGWGDIALLYRKHDIGEALETRLIREGIPCRLAQGRALGDDPVVRYLAAALHLVVSPKEPVYVSLFTRRVLPPALLDHLRTESERQHVGLLQTMRRESRARTKTDPDGRKIRRALAAMDNLPALAAQHPTLRGLVDELLSQRVTRYQTVLEHRADELSDPADAGGIGPLVALLREAAANRRRIVIPPMGGIEIGLAGLLSGAGKYVVDYATGAHGPRPDDLELGPGAGGGLGLALGTFKALQLVDAEAEARFQDCVIFDLETTGLDRDQAEIVEIAAARIRNWKIEAEFYTLVRPRVEIEPGAQAIHGYGAEHLAGAPYFEAVWPAFRAFVGADVLVAHNGYEFDVPVLARMVKGVGERFTIVPFDTLQLARSIVPGSAKLELLAQRFGLDTGRSHHAADDVRTLAAVFKRLEEERVARGRRVALAHLLDHLGVSLALSDPETLGPEAVMLKEVARIYALGRYSGALEFYATERARVGPSAVSVEELIERLGGPGLMARVRAEKRPDERYPNAVARIRRLMDGLPDGTLEDQIAEFLERLALSRSDGAEADPNRINLLTLHATKGLEFSRVYLVGVEDAQMLSSGPGREPSELEIEEARRLVYVGMTRARDRLVLTRAGLRFERSTGGHRFLDEMELKLLTR